MYRVLFLCFLIGLPLTGRTQHTELLQDLLRSHPAANPVVITHRMNLFISTLREKRERYSDKEFVRLIFRESYRKFFDTYKPYTQISEIFENGNYDCLSATSFLSVVLNEFGYDFKIIETNYHIFLSVETDTSPVLLESTDPTIIAAVTNGRKAIGVEVDAKYCELSRKRVVASMEVISSP